MSHILKILEYNNNYVTALFDNISINTSLNYIILSIDKAQQILIGDDNGKLYCRVNLNGLEYNILMDILNNKETIYTYTCNLKFNEQVFYYSGTKLCLKLSIYLDIDKLRNKIKTKEIYDDVLFCTYISHKVSKQTEFNNDFWKQERIKKINSVTQPSALEVQLYSYQLNTLNWMLSLEQNIKQNNTLTLKTNFSLASLIPEFSSYPDINLEYDIIDRKIKEQIQNKQFYTKGGILADEMGLGKTITCVGLILSNQANLMVNNITENKRYNTRATIIICPSHLVDQWYKELTKGSPMLKILKILTKTNHQKISFKQLIDSDVVIVSIQFLMNFNYYIKYNYKHTVPSQAVYCFKDRIKVLFEYLEKLQQKTFKEQMETLGPNLEFINWHRIIIDEGHELFGGITNGNSIICSYLKMFINKLSSTYHWYVSGTPFVNNMGLRSVLDFLDFKITKNTQVSYINKDLNDYITQDLETKISYDDIYKYNNCIISLNNNILNNICYRNTKESVKDELSIPAILTEVIKIELTDLERQLYESKKKYGGSDIILRQLCCHPLISDKEREILGNSGLSLSEVKSGLIDYHTKTIKTYTTKIEKLDQSNQSYHMLKKNFTDKVNESKYLVNIFTNMDQTLDIKDEENMCCICLDNINQLVVTDCGHFYCKECIYNAMKFKKECPNCRKKLDYNKIYQVENITEDTTDTENLLVKKYGSKMGKLIELCKKITSNSNNRIIIFSQWDRLLHLIGTTLKENSIENTYVKGNVYQRTTAISSFKMGKNKTNKNIQVIMLSLEHAASGTNLTEATHIIFTDPISGTIEEIATCENQAIGRACRIGQKNQVRVLKLITSNTIEEELYDNR